MADIQSNIHVNIDTSEALASIKLLQKQISAFHSSMAKSGAAASAVSANMQQNLINSLNATGKFSASMQNVKTTTESFTNALEKNKLSMRDYYRYSMGATRTFGRFFRSEFDTINKVARERVKDLQTQYIKMGRDANGAMKAIAVRPLALDMQNLGTQTAIAAQRQALLNQLLKQGATNMLNFGKNTQWAGRQLMVGFTIPLAYLGTTAAKTFMAMEEQAIRFKRVYGELFTTGEETDKMLKEIQLLAKEFTKYGVSVENTMKMAADAAASGKMGADLLAQINEATRLAVLGGVEQEQALETTISLTNAFGVAAEDLTKKINFLNSVENQTVVSIEDLTIAIPKAGPVVKQLGGDVEDLAFFLTAMKEGGINASEGANALKSGLASLINPTEKASAMLAEMGINIKGIVEGNQGNVKQTVIDFANALNTLDPLNRARAIEQLFGKFQFSRLSTLFQNVIQEGNQASRVLTLTKATTEELAILSERELSRVEESTTYKFKKTVEDLKLAIAPVGEEFLKAITPIAEFVGKVLEKFNDMGDGTKKFIVILTTLLGGIGPIFLMTFGLLANGLANIIKLFVNIKSVFNKAGQSSTILGNQTNYLTSEQLKAAAVASSLNQVHTQLAQTFTSEIAALNALVSAYQRAVTAQAAFGGPIVGGKGRKGFAEGTRKVKPFYFARGTDTVPAMLTPGEAVIPAGPAQDPSNKPAIKHMIAGGSMKLFANGIEEVLKNKTRIGSGSEGRAGKSNVTVMRNQQANISNAAGLVSFTKINPANMTDLTSLYAKEIVRKSGTTVAAINKEIDEWRRANKTAIDAATQAVQQGAQPSKAYASLVRKFNSDMVKAGGPVSKFAATARAMAPLLQKDLIEAQNEARRLKLNVKNSADATLLASKLPNNIVAQGMTQPGNFQSLAKTRGSAVSMFGGASGLGTHGIPRFMITPGLHPSERAYLAGTSQEHMAQTSQEKALRSKDRERRSQAKALARDGRVTAKVLVDSFEQGLKQELQVASPSRRMKKIGQEAGQGLVLGAKEFIDDAKAAGQQLGSGVVQGTQAQRAAASKMSLYGAGTVDPVQKSLRRQLEKQARLEQLALKRSYQQSNVTGFIAGGGGSGRDNNGRGRFAGRFGRPADPNNPQGARTPGQTAGSVAMGLSMAAMAGSMAPGKVGETSQKLMMPLMALSMLAMMPPKIAGVIAALGVLVYSIMSTRMAFDKAQDSMMELVESTQAGSNATKELSKFAGTVSAGEVMDRRRSEGFSPFEIQSGKTTFGQSFVQSELGKSTLSSVGRNIANVGKKQAASDLTNQLVTGVISGSLTPAQARSIAGNIGKELGDYGFGIQVNGKLIELLGPNGENLIKDPLGIRVKMIEETRVRAGLAATKAQEAGAFGGRRKSNILGVSDFTQTLGSTLAGAGTGASIGAAIGSAILPGIGTGIGAVLGTGVGAIAGNFLGRKERQKRIGEASGASVAMNKIALEQQQEMIDSLDLEYQQKIENAKAAGDQAKAEKLTNDYIRDRNSLLLENGKTVSAIQSQFEKSEGATRKALMTGVDKAITKQYKGTAMEDVAPLAKSLIEDSGVSEEKQYTLKMQLATGNIDPIQMMDMLEMFANDKATMNKVVNIIGKFGGTFANQMQGIASMFKNKKQAAKFIAEIETKTPENAQKYLDFFAEISKVGNVVDITTAFEFYQKNPAVAQKVQGIIDEIKEQKGKISLQIASEIVGAKEMEILRANQEYFNSLPPEQQKIYLTTITSMVNMEGNNKQAVQDWLKQNPGKTEGDYYAASAYQVTQASIDKTSGVKPGASTSSAGKVQTSVLDDLVKKLRDVRKNQIKATEGWSASRKVLDNLFGGKKKIDFFGGIEQDLAKLGAKGNFIELIVGMDPKEYEKRKNSLFKFDNKGNIVGLKKDAKTIQEALNSIVAGEFQSSLLQQQQELKDQAKAYNILRDAGVGVSEAHQLIADKALAAMIASEGNSKSAEKLIKLYKQVQAEKNKSEALTKVREDIASAKSDIALKSSLQSKGFSTLEQSAILSDAGLTEMAKNGQWGPAFKERLQQIFDSIEFKESIFQNGFDKAMERFAAMETKIELDFQFATLKDQDVIEKAQDKIAGLNYQIDDWEAQLVEIEKKEEEINEKYDAKTKALETVRSLNEQISRQQKGQLTLADALSQGDISAAARAVQEIRTQQATDAIDAQERALEAAKENELANVRNTLGYTRAQIEGQIKTLRDQIFKIEEEELEPAQERVRIEEAKKRELIQSLTVLGKTKLQWEEIKNRIDLAKTASDEYTNAMKAALDIVDSIVKYWQSLEREFVTTHRIITIYEGGSGPGGSSGSDAGTDSEPKVEEEPGSGDKKDDGNESKDDGSGSKKSGNNGLGGSRTDSAVTGTAPNGRINGVALPSGVVPTNVLNHLNDLGNIQNNIAAASADFGAKIQASKIADEAGQVAASHYMDLYKLSKAVNDANATRVTEMQKDMQKAEANLKKAAPILSNTQKATVANAAKSSTTGASHLADLLAAENKAKAAATKKEAERQKQIAAGKAQQESILKSMGFKKSSGGIITKRYAQGGNVLGTDVVPAMLTPGEFIMSRYAVQNYGVDKMKAINNGEYQDASVYNYSVAVNVRSDANPEEIARAVMTQIKQVDSKRLRGNRL